MPLRDRLFASLLLRLGFQNSIYFPHIYEHLYFMSFIYTYENLLFISPIYMKTYYLFSPYIRKLIAHFPHIYETMTLEK